MAATYLLWVAQSRNTSVLGRAKSHQIFFVSRKVAQIFRSRKVATYPLWVAMVATYIFWVAQIRNKPLRLRKVTTNLFCVPQSRIISVVGRANSRETLVCAKLQHTHFEWQWSQKYIFWVAQSRNISGLGCVKSRNFFGHTKSQHTHFESQWLQQKSPTSILVVIKLHKTYTHAYI